MFVRDNVFPHLEGAFPELRKRDFDTLRFSSGCLQADLDVMIGQGGITDVHALMKRLRNLHFPRWHFYGEDGEAG
ncbi:MAG: hypothetical protein IH935_10215 [Acidobacteria bacterium]|nr:hypothetical protein [Acidobacteriota bacterium]